MPKKERIAIPAVVAARILFRHDRMCCVCRQRKPVQIHHIDDDPSNNHEENLAVLCLDCHRDTQITGGFDRKLDAEQVRLYRAAWLDHVEERRTIASHIDRPASPQVSPSMSVRTVAAQVEIAKEKGDWFELATIYHGIGDKELRDKYIDRAFAEGVQSWEELILRVRQGRIDLLSEAVIDEALDTDDWTSKARMLEWLGRTSEAAATYLAGIQECIESGNYFTAAIYIKGGLSGLVPRLFEMSLAESLEEDDLWWQLRAYEELGWDDAKRELLLGNEARIRQDGSLPFLRALAAAKGDDDFLLQVEKQLAEAGPMAWGSVETSTDEDPEEGEDQAPG